MENNYLNKTKDEHLREFMNVCIEVGINLDKEKFYTVVKNTLKYLNGNKEIRNELVEMQELENNWYLSLDKGIADYSVYDNTYYLADTWVCWKKYAKEYLKRVIKHIKPNLEKINSIADLGCGIGYSTAALKEIFDCDVYGTNLKDTKQFKICEKVARDGGFEIKTNLKDVGKVDLIFASEYFEHFERPIEHLIEVIENLKPKHILFANTFNAKSIGHFNIYIHEDLPYNGRTISRMFNKKLIELGYNRIITKCWNNRPNYYTNER